MAATAETSRTSVTWDREQCSNCLLCVVVCAERHTGTSAPTRARIHLSVNPVTGAFEASYCRQCEDAACAAACPLEAIQFDPTLGVWRVDEELCIGCGECEAACAWGAIRLDAVTGLAAKCDLCLGAARCAEVCPTKALAVGKASG